MTKASWIFLVGMALLGVALILPSTNQVVKEGDSVTVNYTLRLNDGNVYDSSIGSEPLKATLGQGALIPGFEEELIGMRIGESKTFTLPPEKAYGQYRSDLIGIVERSWLPEDVEPVVGKQLQTELQDGTPVMAVITAFTDTTLTLDANHLLAGKTLTFDIELLGIGNNTTAISPNQARLGWLILVLAVAVASFLFFKTRNLQFSTTAKKRLGARSKHF